MAMMDHSDEERLKRLANRIAEARKVNEDPARGVPDHHSQAQVAWRMVTELVAGLLVGLGIGMGLDALFGTRPIMLVLFTLLGFAAGVRVMLRTAQSIPAHGGDDAAAPPAARDNEEDGRRG